MSVSFSENVEARYSSYGWHVQTVQKGDTDLDAIDHAIAAARAETLRPSLIVVKTTIGFGSPNKAGKASSHGSPLGADEIALTKKALGWDPEKKFYIPDEASKHFRLALEKGKVQQSGWEKLFAAYQEKHPDLAALWHRVQAGDLPEGFDQLLPTFKAGEAVETRTAAGKVLNALAAKLPELIGGDADLAGSTKTNLKDAGDFDGQTGKGNNIHFGVREHAMGSIANGIAYHGGLRPFTATFFTFSDYMRPAVRLAALNHLPVVFVWTHDSIALGEDGPTHQAVEHLAALRAMPNLYMVRPCDGAESAQAWRMALERTEGPTGLVLTRQKVAGLDRTKLASAEGLHKGAYVLSDCEGQPAALLLATGSEVQLAVAAQETLQKEGIPTRVISMPCWEAFKAQPASYREEVLLPSVPVRVSIEAGVTFGWDKWVGDEGVAIGIDRYGSSAPAEVVMEHCGITAAHIVKEVKRLVGGA